LHAGGSLVETMAEYNRRHEEFLAGMGNHVNVRSMEWLPMATNQQQFIVQLKKRLEAQDVANKQMEKNIRAEAKNKSAENFKRGFVEGVFVSSVFSLFVLGWVVMRYL
jgi:hypothetical protein